MYEDKLIDKIIADCPLCNSTHTVEKRQRRSQALVKGEAVDYSEVYYFCGNSEDENEFVPGLILEQNLLSAKNAYREYKKLLTSTDIIEIRKYYGLTQVEYSTILGWGEVTVTRYESKTIQDETYDRIMRLSKDNPMFMLECLNNHHDRFSDIRFNSIRSIIIQRINEVGSYYLTKQLIFSQYVLYETPSNLNGNKVLDLNKLANVLGYFALFVKNLYKVKLMKLLWYADVLYFRRYGQSITGLVYVHMPLGALPIAYDEITSLPPLRVEEELIKSEVAYRIYSMQDVSLASFTFDELNVLDLVSQKFMDYNTRDIVDYMHQESAYQNTNMHDVIPYDIAKDLRELK